MTIQQIKYIIGVSDSGSLNKASERLFISQPSLSSSLRDAEDELGFRIFRRTSRGVEATERGISFISDAREFFAQYEKLLKKHTCSEKKYFSVSALYYAFARKAFVEIVNSFSDDGYDFAFREDKVSNVIADVALEKSGIGILYISESNRDEITRNLRASALEFHPLTECNAFVFLHKNHPLSEKESISLEELSDYKFVTFDTDDVKSFFSDESIRRYSLDQAITVADRSTELNLIKSLNGYTFLSGVLGEETNEDFVLVPLKDCGDGRKLTFELGYITKKGGGMEKIALSYIGAVRRILDIAGLS